MSGLKVAAGDPIIHLALLVSTALMPFHEVECDG